MSSVAFAEKLSNAEVSRDPGESYPDVPAAIRAHLNAELDRDVLVRMQHLARKRRALRPEITEEQMADYLALAENCENFEQWLKLRQAGPLPPPARGTLAWVIGTLAILALLTTGLIAAIAVSVSGL